MFNFIKRLFRRDSKSTEKVGERVVRTSAKVEKIIIDNPNQELAKALVICLRTDAFPKRYQLVNNFIGKHLVEAVSDSVRVAHLTAITNDQLTKEIKSFASQFFNRQLKCTNTSLIEFLNRVHSN